MPELCLGAVMENRRLAENVCALTVYAAGIADRAVPGQFVHVRCGADSLLRRPVSVCDAGGGAVTLVIEARGAGTGWLISRKAGDTLDMLGPLGRGFDLSGGSILLAGGGIGAPPLLYAAKKAAGRVTAVLGFRSRGNVILEDAFRSVCGGFYVTTEDGSAGERGLVTGPLEKLLRRGGWDGILSCGPRPMLRAVAEMAAAYGVPCQVSLEERMGCGIGACLVCACKTREDGGERMRHVCKDGPVFRAEEVVW